ncbi:MAG: branched-chain amino acid ABC transporter permease [Alphaproteobacteria bacterium]
MLFQLFLNTLIVGSEYGLIAMAFRLMYSVSPFFNMTLGAIVAFSSYLMFSFATYTSIPLVFAMLLVVFISALFSYLLEAGIYTPMRSKGASSMILLVASLGVYTIFEAVVQLVFGPEYKNLTPVNQTSVFNILGQSVPLVQIVSIVCNFAIFFGLKYLLEKSFVGKMVRAVNDSSTLSNIIGIDNNKIILLISLLVGAILGISGILVGYDTGMQPNMGFDLLFKGMIGAIIGGLANLRGAFLGAFFLAFAENLGVWAFASEWRNLVAFVIFIVFLSLRPKGIFQKKERG